jgi:uncharacterized membrane protein YgaE (UPF0421/DUF939 family)
VVSTPHLPSRLRDLPERREELLELAAERSRMESRTRWTRLRANAGQIALNAVAAGIAWVIATEVLEHQRPFFAPVAAIIALGTTIGQRGRRAFEVAIGVALGIFVADAIVLEVGTGTAQIVLVVGLAMAAAVLLGSGQLLLTQAAVSAALVATLQPPSDGFSFDRFLDALVGGGVALTLSTLLFPVDPLAMARRAARPLLDELAAVLDEVAAAIESRDLEAAEDALDRARGVDTAMATLADTLAVADDIARYAPRRRPRRTAVERYVAAAPQLDFAVRNVRVLARGVIRAITLNDNVPAEVADAVRDLATAVHALCEELERPSADSPARTAALQAAATATEVLENTSNLSVSVIVGQVRSTATDLLRALGVDRDRARQAVRGEAPA